MDERATFGPRGGNDVGVHDGYLYLALERGRGGGQRRGWATGRRARWTMEGLAGGSDTRILPVWPWALYQANFAGGRCVWLLHSTQHLVR